jgi:nitrate/TMAO reductase-like tetraheme cytochrome c subunit
MKARSIIDHWRRIWIDHPAARFRGGNTELQQTIHYSNRSGVRAICSDCHVPHEWFAKVRRKIQASNELLHKVMGTIDTPEKYEAQRPRNGKSRVGLDEIP